MSLDEEGCSAEKPDDGRSASSTKKTLTYDKAEAFYAIRLRLPHDCAMREAVHSMLAMWQAAHNTDYYITKYGTKALEQLQNLIGQFALGLRRLELEEQQERDAGDAAVLAQHQDYKRRARRITLRLAMAANRATWASCCEMALFIRTKAHVRKTYFPRDIYLSRLAFLSHTCLRLLNSGDSFLLEASDLMHHGTTNLSTISFSAQTAQTKPSPLSNDAKLADTTDPKDHEIPLSNVAKLAGTTELEDTELLHSEGVAKDDDANEEDSNNDEADSEKGSEESCVEGDPTEHMVDADIIQMKTLRATTSTHDDWLHRGPYLHDIAFHTYVEYVDRVRMPRSAPIEQQIFRFEPHYALALSYGQQIRTPARIPVLEALKFVPPGETTREENALYKLLVGSLLRCSCAGNCSDPLLFKPLLSRPGTAEKPGQWCWRFTWKARRAELQVLATRGEEKTKRARRVPCIHDTTMIRGWLPDAASSSRHEDEPPPMLLRATLAQYSRAQFGMMWPDGFAPLLNFLSIANTHPDQLTLAEFAALRTRRLVQHLDMMAIARTVELNAKTKEGNAEDENDDADIPRKVASHMESEFMGGEHDIDDDGGIHEEDFWTDSSPPTHLRGSDKPTATG
ncbi:MAG: hypothetical protein NZ577_03990 [Vicinamibacterales bacterium]|nr:hypothetical protein [Vicinamibacterales bacterium]